MAGSGEATPTLMEIFSDAFRQAGR
jgi:hypothetical protein